MGRCKNRRSNSEAARRAVASRGVCFQTVLTIEARGNKKKHTPQDGISFDDLVD